MRCLVRATESGRARQPFDQPRRRSSSIPCSSSGPDDRCGTFDHSKTTSPTSPLTHASPCSCWASWRRWRSSLSAVGVYGVVSYAMSRRAREIAVRLALGASRQRLVGQVVRGGAVWTIVGLIGGLAGASVLAGQVEALLFRVGSHDLVDVCAGRPVPRSGRACGERPSGAARGTRRPDVGPARRVSKRPARRTGRASL